MGRGTEAEKAFSRERELDGKGQSENNSLET
jgi:hypothetical protein